MNNTKTNKQVVVLETDEIRSIARGCGCKAHKTKMSASMIDDKFLDKLAAKQGVKRFKF